MIGWNDVLSVLRQHPRRKNESYFDGKIYILWLYSSHMNGEARSLEISPKLLELCLSVFLDSGPSSNSLYSLTKL